jgi:RNA polymerase sigma factor (sigma-70 family)
MTRKSESHVLRQIRALYAHGRAGGLTDAQLVERFLNADGAEKEDAFAALVDRHGPMVLGVCRRVLSGSADAEDAFQAVFLVLARKAGSVRQLAGLKSWLYGVAVRTANEARRRLARRLAREGGRMDESHVASAADEGTGDLLALLVEEIDRLPPCFREPLILCELDGLSRQDAARQLGLPEGTLSSRLSRGRSRLRERLSRRGVTLGAGGLTALFPEPATAAISGSLAEATVRFSLTFAAGEIAAGSVPAAVASLAEGVLAMIAVARWKLVLVAASALAAAGFLVGGLAWAVAPAQQAGQPKGKAPVAVAKVEEKPATPRSREIHGIVVDDTGQPVEGALVLIDAFQDREARATTGPEGTFAVASPHRSLEGTHLVARTPDATGLGTFQYGYRLSREEADAPARIVLRRPREIVAQVTDAKQAPVPGAGVEAVVNYAVIADATTDANGQARLLLPVDSGVMWIFALKSGLGFDYAEYGTIDEAGRNQGAAPVSEIPAHVGLTLDGARTARIKAVDRDDKPLAGVRFAPWLLHKNGRRSDFNSSSRITQAVTGADGVARFDWLPANPQEITFWPHSEEFVDRRVMLAEDETETITARLIRAETIRGKVVYPDGSPAPGIEVNAYGTGVGMDHGQAQVRTEADGTYEMSVGPDEAYAVYVDDKDWAARSRLDVVVRQGQSVEHVDFSLTRGTILRGTVTIGPDNRPAAGQYMRLDETGKPLPQELRREGDNFSRVVHRQWGPYTDAQGHYSVRIGPGTYTLFGPPHLENQTITIGDEAEVVRDFRMPRPETGTLAGRVVLAGAEERPIAGARVEVAAALITSVPFAVTTDADGQFEVERELVRVYLCAKSPDGRLGALVELGAEDAEVVIRVAPTATASGRLLDEKGEPAANLELHWGRRIPLTEKKGGPSMNCFAPRVKTDALGRFTLPSLVVGQEYNISVLRGNVFPATGVVRPDAPGPIDLGTLTIGGYRPKPGTREVDALNSSFEDDAPGAGRPAPNIEATSLDGQRFTLDDFRGKYVLLDFWATWCGPCIAEIPQLQAVHEAFGQDGRFLILSLSVDEKLDEPRAFQEKRKLPWTQAFLGGGIHGPIPRSFGVKAIPAFVLIGPDGAIVARGMRGNGIKSAVGRALGARP